MPRTEKARKVRLYYSGGGEAETGHILALREGDLKGLRKREIRYRRLFASDDTLDYVGWYACVGEVFAMIHLSEGGGDRLRFLFEQLLNAGGDCVLVDEVALADLVHARTECDEVKFHRAEPDSVSIEWRAKHADNSNYYVRVNLGE